jgi:phage-related protein
MRGMGSGVFEIALAFRGNAFRVVYTLQFGEEVWVVHAFQKKSTQGIKTPKREIDPVQERLNRLKEMLRRRTNQSRWHVGAEMFSVI